eukprot:gene19394-biopygen6045
MQTSLFYAKLIPFSFGAFLVQGARPRDIVLSSWTVEFAMCLKKIRKDKLNNDGCSRVSLVVVTKQSDCGTFKLRFVRENEPEMTARSSEKKFINKQST